MALGSLTVKIRADIAGLTTGLAQAQAHVRAASTSMQNAGHAMERVGRSLSLVLTLPIVAFGTAAIRSAGNFQSAMLRVQALSGATGVELKALEEQAARMGATTRFTATDAADALGFMSMAGMRAEQSLAALPGVLTLAASAGLEMGEAADIVTNVLAGMGMQVDELGRLNDVLVRTFTRTNTSLSQLGQAMKYVAPVANAAGVEVEYVAAAIGLMGNAGIQGSMAGTSLRSAISRLLSPTDQIKGAMRAAGIEVKRFEDGSFDLLGTMREFEPHAENVSLLMTVFGQRAGPGMAAILSQGTAALEGMIIELELAEGTADRIARSQMAGFNGAMASLESSVEAASHAIANSGLLEFMTEFIQGPNGDGGLVGMFRALSGVNPELLRLATIFAGVAAALPVLILTVGGLVRALGAILGVLAGPVGVIAVLASVAIAIPLWRNLKAEIDGVTRAMNATQEPMAAITRLNEQIARTSGAVAEGYRQQRTAQLELLYVQERAARAAAMQAAEGFDEERALARRRGPLAFMSIPGLNRANETLRAALRELQTTTDQISETEEAIDLVDNRARYTREYQAAREALTRDLGENSTPAARRAWYDDPANAPYIEALRRGGELMNAGLMPIDGSEIDLSGNTGPATPSQRRAAEIQTLRELSEITATTSREFERLTAIQEVMNESARDGEQITYEVAAAFVDERDALQSTIDKRREAIELAEQNEQAHKAMVNSINDDIRAQNQLTEAANQGIEAYERMLLIQQLLRENPVLSEEEAGTLADKIRAATDALEEATERMQRFEELWDSLGKAVGSAFEKAILDGEKLGDVLKSLARDIAALVLRTLVTQPLADAISGFLSGVFSGSSSGGGGGSNIIGAIVSSIGSFFGGFFAEGGYLRPGKWGVVGENGPELISGGAHGATIAPANDAVAPTYVDARTYINAPGADAAQLARVQSRLARMEASLPQRIRGEMANANARGRGWTP